MSRHPPRKNPVLSFEDACEMRDRDGLAGLVLDAWEEVRQLPTVEEAVEAILRAGFEPAQFTRMVRAAEDWRKERGTQYRPMKRGGPGDLSARYDFRIQPVPEGARASITERRTGRLVWEQVQPTAPRALAAMARESLRIRPARAKPLAADPERAAEIEFARVWLDAAEAELRQAVISGDAAWLRLADSDAREARENYLRVMTGAAG